MVRPLSAAASESSRQTFNGGGDSPAAAAAQDGPVYYLVEKANLRSDTSMTSPAVRVLRRCDAVLYVQGREDWFRVRTLASGVEGAAEGWIHGYLVSKNKSGCEEKRAAY